ncbi:MAG: type III pantothenate kinase [Flavobacteriaceae bacterium]|nr:type III pantothenate kinase [Flavobacteriaceae bacterium]
MNLIVDIGNTRTKIALFNKDKLKKARIIKTKKLLNEIKIIFEKYRIEHSIISSVVKTPIKIVAFLTKNSNCIDLSNETKIPFKNLYKTPKTLGVDRIALIAGAVQLYKNKNTLVIDAGTCITYDFINAKNEYFGGAISLGINMRYEALHKFTANLPLLKPKTIPEKGNTTKKAIHKGVINSLYLEIEGVIKQYQKKNKNLTIVLTGGDTKFLVGLLKSSIFANPNFLLVGLNYILNYNLQE